MNKMVKWVVLCLLLALSVSFLTGCSGNQPEDTGATTTTPENPSDTTGASGNTTGTTEETDPSDPGETTVPSTTTTPTDGSEATDPTNPAETTVPSQGTEATQPQQPTTPGDKPNPPATTKPQAAVGEEETPASLVIGSNTAKPTGNGGYYFTYTATKDGTLSLQLPESDWSYQITNLTSGEPVIKHTSADELIANPAQVNVLKGDQIKIMVNTLSGKAGTVSITADLGDAMGTKENPIHVSVGSVNAIRVPAGKSVYLSGRTQGTTMVIKNAASAKLTFQGTDYQPANGVISAKMPAFKPGDSSTLEFVIANTGSEVQIYSVEFAIPVGTTDNPEKLVLGNNAAVIEADDADGYIFTWTATADGTLTLNLPTDQGWWYVINNLTTYQYGSFCYSNDKPAQNPATVEVKKGDVIQISVCTFSAKKPNNAPAGTVNFTASFKEA